MRWGSPAVHRGLSGRVLSALRAGAAAVGAAGVTSPAELPLEPSLPMLLATEGGAAPRSGDLDSPRQRGGRLIGDGPSRDNTEVMVGTRERRCLDERLLHVRSRRLECLNSAHNTTQTRNAHGASSATVSRSALRLEHRPRAGNTASARPRRGRAGTRRPPADQRGAWLAGGRAAAGWRGELQAGGRSPSPPPREWSAGLRGEPLPAVLNARPAGPRRAQAAALRRAPATAQDLPAAEAPRGGCRRPAARPPATPRGSGAAAAASGA